MNDESKRVIIFFVSDGKLLIGLVNDVPVDTIKIVLVDSPQGHGLMDMLGGRLRDGPIVCRNDAEVERLAAYLSKKASSEATDLDHILCFDRSPLHDLRVDRHYSPPFDRLACLAHISSMRFHEQLNWHANRPGRADRKPKLRRRF
jgi:hypothetical protein